MKEFDRLIKEMDLSYFGQGKHKITFEKVMELRKTDEIFILDVRSSEENQFVKLPFVHCIPMHEVPDRMNEIPKDKTIAVFCSSATRATIIFAYLLSHDYNAKIMLDSIGKIADNFKPGFVLKSCN